MSRQNQIRNLTLLVSLITLVACNQAQVPADPGPTPEMSATKQSISMVPIGPWGDGDQKGMANTIGGGTWLRCSHYLAQEGAKSYELSHVRSNDMTQSPFGVPLVYDYRPTAIGTEARAIRWSSCGRLDQHRAIHFHVGRSSDSRALRL